MKTKIERCFVQVTVTGISNYPEGSREAEHLQGLLEKIARLGHEVVTIPGGNSQVTATLDSGDVHVTEQEPSASEEEMAAELRKFFARQDAKLADEGGPCDCYLCRKGMQVREAYETGELTTHEAFADIATLRLWVIQNMGVDGESTIYQDLVRPSRYAADALEKQIWESMRQVWRMA